MENGPCQHIDQIKVTADRDGVKGCEDCLKINGRWVHLRMCLTCGKIGCCDNSPNRHATRHFRETQHAIIQSVEPGETWVYCYHDQVTMPEPPPTL